MQGKGYWSLTMMSFSAQKVTQMRGAEPGFLTMIKGEAAEDVDTRINNLHRLSSIHYFSSLRSVSDIEYIWPNGGLLLLMSGIA